MYDSIKEKRQKIKRFVRALERRDVFLIFVIFLIAFGSFGLGRLSRIREARVPVRVEYGQQGAVSIDAVQSAGKSSALLEAPENDAGANLKHAAAVGQGAYVASKSGAKYHFPWCSGAQRIKEENKVWFESANAARSAGYEPAANCKGLD